MTDLTRRTLFRLALGAGLAVSLAACGKRGALEAPYTPEEEAAEARRASDPTAGPPKRRDSTIHPPRRDTPFDFLL